MNYWNRFKHNWSFSCHWHSTIGAVAGMGLSNGLNPDTVVSQHFPEMLISGVLAVNVLLLVVAMIFSIWLPRPTHQ